MASTAAKRCRISLGEGQKQSPKQKTAETAKSASQSVRSEEDKAAPPALSTLLEESLGQAHAKPRVPLTPAKEEQEHTVETDPSSSRVGKEEFRSVEAPAVWREGDVQAIAGPPADAHSP